jgi:hypothetical protein
MAIEHVKFLDVKNDGTKREVAILKAWDSGDIHYIDIPSLGPIDKARLKAALNSPSAKTMPLWEVLSGITLNNGINALDFFHSNHAKVIKGADKEGKVHGGLDRVSDAGVGKMIGSDFVNPAEAMVGDEGKGQGRSTKSK